MLFAILCLQLSFESIYNYIIQNADDCYDGSFLKSLTSHESYTDGNDAERLSCVLNLRTDEEIINAIDFMTVFMSILDQDGDGELTKDEVTSFINTLRFSTITANTVTATNAEENLESRYRYYNRDIIKDVLFNIQGSLNGALKIYQARTNNNPNWKKHYAGGWKSIVTSFGNVNFEFKVATRLQEKESSLSVYIYPTDKTDRKKFVEQMQVWFAEQKYGFIYLEENCGFWLDNKTVHADAREEIIQYFTEIVPSIISDIEKVLRT